MEPAAHTAPARGSPLYYSLRFLPPERRRAATAVYALVGALEQATAGVAEETVARTKLAWWRGELERLYGGAARHPAARSLQPWLARYSLPAEYLQEILTGLEMDLDRPGYGTFRDLRLHCQQVGANAALLAGEIFGYGDPHTPRFAQAVGIAQCLARSLRSLRDEAASGRLHIPQDELQRFGLTATDLHAPQTSDRVRELARFQLARIREHYRQALAMLPPRDRGAQHPFLVQIALDQALWNEIERDGLRLLEHRVELPVLRRLWIAWRTARRARRPSKRP